LCYLVRLVLSCIIHFGLHRVCRYLFLLSWGLDLKIEQAGAYKDFFKKHKVKLGHFRVGETRIIGLLKGEVFYVVDAVPRGALEKELNRIISQFPFTVD
jgi:hypothetical protein